MFASFLMLFLPLAFRFTHSSSSAGYWDFFSVSQREEDYARWWFDIPNPVSVMSGLFFPGSTTSMNMGAEARMLQSTTSGLTTESAVNNSGAPGVESEDEWSVWGKQAFLAAVLFFVFDMIEFASVILIIFARAKDVEANERRELVRSQLKQLRSASQAASVASLTPIRSSSNNSLSGPNPNRGRPGQDEDKIQMAAYVETVTSGILYVSMLLYTVLVGVLLLHTTWNPFNINVVELHLERHGASVGPSLLAGTYPHGDFSTASGDEDELASLDVVTSSREMKLRYVLRQMYAFCGFG